MKSSVYLLKNNWNVFKIKWMDKQIYFLDLFKLKT